MRNGFVEVSSKIASLLGDRETDEKWPFGSFSQDFHVPEGDHRAFCQGLGDWGQGLTT